MGPASNSPAVEALRLLERAQALAPDRPDVTERLARAHELLGRADSSVQYRLLSARQWEDHGEPDSAERIYRAVLEREPSHAAAAQCLIDLLLESGRESEARQLLLSCADRLLDRGEPARAIEVLRRGLERVCDGALERKLAELLERTGASADAADSLLKLARQAAGQEKRGDAINFYRRALALAPGDALAAAQLAGLLAQERQPEEARRLYLSLADAAEGSLAWGDALQWLARAEELGEPSPPLLSRLAETARKAEKPDAAARALSALVDAYDALQNTRQMAETLRRLLEFSPDDLKQRKRLAEACHAMGQPAEAARQMWDVARRQKAAGKAKAWLESCLLAWQWAPEEPGLVEAVVDALAEAGRGAQAAEVCMERAAALRLPRQAPQMERLCRRALELSPQLAPARERLVDALAALGQRGEAAEIALLLARQRGQEGVLDVAQGWVQRARQLAPEHPGARELLLALLEQSGDRARLEQQLLEEVSDLWVLGQKEEALRLIGSAAQRCPDSEAVQRRRLELAQQVGDAAARRAALSELARLYASRPASPEALAAHAQCAAEEPDSRARAEAWLACAEALGAAPAIDDARRHLVELLRRGGDRAALLAELEKTIAAHPDDVAAAEERLAMAGADAPAETRRAWRLALADTAFRAGLFGKAMEVYSGLADEQPDQPAWHEQRAACALKLGSPPDAIAAYRAGAAQLAGAGRAQEAYRLLRRAVELAPSQPALRAEEARLLVVLEQPFRAATVYRDLSGVLARDGSLEQAAEALKSASQLLPEDASLRGELIELYRRAGLTRAALQEARGFAESCHAAGRSAEALEMLDRALALDPRHKSTLLLRVRWLAEAGRGDDAARSAIELSTREREEGQLTGALETLSEAARLLPEHAPLAAALRQLEADYAQYRRRSGMLERIELAGRLLAEGKADAAVADFEEMLLSQPDNLEVQAGLATAYRQCGRHEDAATVALRLARVYADRGALPAAMRQLEGVLEYLPAHVAALEELVSLARRVSRGRAPEFLLRLAAARAAAGGSGAAAETYRLVLVEQPDNLAAWSGLADVLQREGRDEEAARSHLEAAHQCELRFNLHEAVRHGRQALAIRPDFLPAEERLVDYLGQMGRPEEAQTHLLRAVDLLQQKNDSDRAVALLEDYLGGHPEVLALRTRLLELYRGAGRTDNLVEQHLALARLYERRGEREAAQPQYEAVLQLDEGNVAARGALAEACLAAGRRRDAARHWAAVGRRFRADAIFGRALDYFRRALECEPDDLSLREEIAACLVEEGSPAKAVNEYILVGDVHFRNQAYSEALVSYGRALELEPENLRTLGKLVSAHETAGHTEKAAETLFEMADIYARRSLTWKSREAAARALRLAPEEGVLRRFLERSTVAGDLASAITTVRELLDFFPRHFQERARAILEEAQPGGRAASETRREPEKSYSYESWQSLREPAPAGADRFGAVRPRAPGDRDRRESLRATPRQALDEGLKLFSRRRYSRALSKLQEVAAMPRHELSQNDLADLCSAMGQCLIELGFPRDAVEPFQSGLSMRGIDEEREKSLQYGLARALEECGQRHKAMDLYKLVYAKDAAYRDVKIRLLWSRKK